MQSVQEMLTMCAPQTQPSIVLAAPPANRKAANHPNFDDGLNSELHQ